MNILVIYNSKNGHTQEVANKIARIARSLNHHAKVKSVAEVHRPDIVIADVIFVGTWVHGLVLFGVRPAGADLWVPALPSFEGKPVGIFCTYMFNPRSSLQMLSKLLEAQGASIRGQHALQRDHVDDGLEAFVEEIIISAHRIPA